MSEETKSEVVEPSYDHEDFIARLNKVAEAISGSTYTNGAWVLINCLISVFKQAQLPPDVANRYLMQVSDRYVSVLEADKKKEEPKA
jgi:hypothetical protein